MPDSLEVLTQAVVARDRLLVAAQSESAELRAKLAERDEYIALLQDSRTKCCTVLQRQLADAERRLTLARELIQELRGYCGDQWDWKYGARWDREVGEIGGADA